MEAAVHLGLSSCCWASALSLCSAAAVQLLLSFFSSAAAELLLLLSCCSTSAKELVGGRVWRQGFGEAGCGERGLEEFFFFKKSSGPVQGHRLLYLMSSRHRRCDLKREGHRRFDLKSEGHRRFDLKSERHRRFDLKSSRLRMSSTIIS